MNEETVPGQLDAIKGRLLAGEKRMAAIEASLVRGALRMTRIETDLAKNTTDTREGLATSKRIETNTQDMVAWSHAFEGVLKVLEGTARLAKPIGVLLGLVVATGAAWAGFKHWLWP